MKNATSFLGMAILFFSVNLVLAQQPEGLIKGAVTDAETKQPLVGANVILFATNLGAISDAQGKFTLPHLGYGKYTIQVSYVGYQTVKREIQIDRSEIELFFQLNSIVLHGQKVIVTATRAKIRETPIVFSDISRRDLQQSYWAQDLPMLLTSIPNVYSYSDAGNGIGYSYLKIRGFEQKRIAVMINGVPLNDPEDHNVYWVDMPDLAASVQDIQIQRGVGSSLYGSPAFGGSVNILTSELTSERSMNVTTGYGSYNTRKFSTQFNSGLVDGTYAVTARYSKVTTDGYRERSNIDLWSYFISAARYGKSTTTQINLYGGPEITHAAWDASSASELNTNHRHNPITYSNTIDDFNQPHYELIHNWQITTGLEFNNTFYYIRGKGYYETFKSGRDLIEYGYNYFYTADSVLVEETDLVRQKWVAKNQVGWTPRLTLEHHHGSLTFGGDFFTYNSNHWGDVIWAAQLPPTAQPDYKYYQYSGKKLSTAGFVHELWRANKHFQILADINVQYKTYQFDQAAVANFIGSDRHAFSVSYLFLNPKLGVNWNVTDRWNLFTNFSMANLEPSDDDLYDIWLGPDNLGVPPLFKKATTVYKNGKIDHIEWRDPLTKPERLSDFEVGGSFRSSRLTWNLNGYYMNFSNEIVPYGQVGEDGRAIKGNAKSTVHRGIETEIACQQELGGDYQLQVAGNCALSQNYFKEFTQYDAVYDDNWNFVGNKPTSFNGKTIAGFPGRLMLIKMGVQGNGLQFDLQWQYVGKQYLDNRENAERTISAFDVATLHLSYRLVNLLGLRELKCSLWLNNLFNNKYETAGYYDDWTGANYYYPAARRNFFVSLTTSL